MRKVMTILAVAALSVSTAFAGGVEDATKDPTPLATESTTGTYCTNSMVEAMQNGCVKHTATIIAKSS